MILSNKCFQKITKGGQHDPHRLHGPLRYRFRRHRRSPHLLLAQNEEPPKTSFDTRRGSGKQKNK